MTASTPPSGDLVHSLDSAPDLGRAELRGLLGGKGAGLVAMSRLGLPVPPGFVLTTEACRRFVADGWNDDLEAALQRGLKQLQVTTGKHFGNPTAPLLVSVRSGSEVSMPGMMDTILNVGAGPPTAAIEQLRAAVQAVFESWGSPRAHRYREIEAIDHTLGTAATVQAMVFGNRDDRSGTGVAVSRDPITGERGLTGDFLFRAQGDDVMAGSHSTLPLEAMRDRLPDCFERLAEIARRLELELTDMVGLEFTIESGTLWLLQVRSGKRSQIATFRIAADMAEDPEFPIDRAEAVRRCAPLLDMPKRVLARAARTDGIGATVIASGLPASPGAASGELCLDPDRAVVLRSEGRDVVLVRNETSPSDVHGIAASRAIFTTLGGPVSHAAVVAREWDIPAVVGASRAQILAGGLRGPGGFVPTGATVTVDGDTGDLLVGAVAMAERGLPAEISLVRRWADELSSSLRPRPENREATTMQESTFQDPDGVEVFTRHWPVDQPRGVVVVAHGMSEHSGRYDRFAKALNEAGYAVAALDHRGHGRTADSTGIGRLGPGNGERLVDDLDQLVSDSKKNHPGLPVVLFGHSMGSMIAQAYAVRHSAELVGYVLSGCPGVAEGTDEMLVGLAAAVEGGMGDEPAAVLSGFNEAFEPARTPYDWLSRDESEVDAYLADPMCGDQHPMTYGFLSELFHLSAPSMEAGAIGEIAAVPVLMVTGEQDPAAGMAEGARRLEGRLREAGLDVTAHYYPGARHEVLNETNRDEVTADIVSWLEGVVPA